MVPALAGGWKKKGRNDRTTVGQIWRGPFKLPNNFTGPQGWEKSWNKRRGSHGVRRKTGKDVGRDSGIPAATVEPIHAFNSPFFYAFNYTLVTFFCLQPTNQLIRLMSSSSDWHSTITRFVAPKMIIILTSCLNSKRIKLDSKFIRLEEASHSLKSTAKATNQQQYEARVKLLPTANHRLRVGGKGSNFFTGKKGQIQSKIIN